MIINLVDLLVYRKYLEIFVGRRRTSTEISICLLFIAAFMNSIVNQQYHNVLNLIVSISILILYGLQYKVSLRTRAVAIVVFMGITFITEPIGYLVHMMLIRDKIYDSKISFFLLAFICEILRMIIVEFFCMLKREKTISISNMPKEVLYTLYAIPMTSIISCILIIEMAKEIVNPELVVMCMTIIFTIIICNYLIFSMVHRYAELSEDRRETELLYQESRLKEEYYRDMEQSIEQIHNLKHDMKNQLMGLYDLIAEKQNQEVKQKLSSMVMEVAEVTAKTYSLNPVINSILKIKFAEAQRKRIKVDCEVLVPKRMSIDVGDYGVLYGNLLDNAIEACLKVEQPDRYIHIRSKYQEGILMLVITNSKENIMNPEMLTTKGDKKMHGRGIHSVRKISEKYGGTLVLKDQGTEFETNLMLTDIHQGCVERSN